MKRIDRFLVVHWVRSVWFFFSCSFLFVRNHYLSRIVKWIVITGNWERKNHLSQSHLFLRVLFKMGLMNAKKRIGKKWHPYPIYLCKCAPLAPKNFSVKHKTPTHTHTQIHIVLTIKKTLVLLCMLHFVTWYKI